MAKLKKVPQFWLEASADFALEALVFMYEQRYDTLGSGNHMQNSAEARSLLRSIKDFRQYRGK